MSNFQDLSSSQIVISWVHWVNTYDLKPCIYTQFLCRLECTLLVTIFIVLDPSVTFHLSVWNFYVIGAKCNWKLLGFRTMGVGQINLSQECLGDQWWELYWAEGKQTKGVFGSNCFCPFSPFPFDRTLTIFMANSPSFTLVFDKWLDESKIPQSL